LLQYRGARMTTQMEAWRSVIEKCAVHLQIVNRRETLFASTTMPSVWVGLKVSEMASRCMPATRFTRKTYGTVHDIKTGGGS
jgi:hypothetical protein